MPEETPEYDLDQAMAALDAADEAEEEAAQEAQAIADWSGQRIESGENPRL